MVSVMSTAPQTANI